MIAIRNAWGEKRVIPNSDSPELGTTFDTRGKTMKKVLLATTALALSAGVASAEIKLGGYANMGLSYTAGTSAVQGVHTDESAAYLNALNSANNAWVDLEAGDAVIADDMADLITNKGAKALLLASKQDAAYVLAGTTSAAYIANLAAATAAQDADALAALAEIAADVAADSDVVDAQADYDEAVALAAAASGAAGTDASTVFVNRMEFNVDGSFETTSGITFGARTRMRVNAGETGVFSGTRVYMSTGGFEVAMGNIGGAIWTIPGVWASEVGLNGMSDAGVVFNTVANPATAWGTHGFSSQGGGANGIEVSYSGGGFSGRLAYSDEDTSGGVSTVQRTSAHASYNMGDWTATVAMQDSSVANEDKTMVVVDGKVGDVGVNFAAADNNGETKIALTGSVTMGATTVHGFVADEESGDNLALGLNVSHDIGGAAIIAAFERDAVGVNRAEAGVSFSF
jgi:outer membrane protein OmpU